MITNNFKQDNTVWNICILQSFLHSLLLYLYCYLSIFMLHTFYTYSLFSRIKTGSQPVTVQTEIPDMEVEIDRWMDR